MNLFGTTWKSRVSFTWWQLGTWGITKTSKCYFVHVGRLQVKIRKKPFGKHK